MAPLLLIPLVVAASGGTGYAFGSWNSNGWIKWVVILIIITFLFVHAKKLGVIPK